MIGSIFPKALVLKEWYQHRWYALLVLMLVSPSVLMLPWHAILPVSTINGDYALHGLPTLHAQMQRNFDTFIARSQPSSTTGLWASYVVIGFSVLTFFLERKNYALWDTLTSPVSRPQVLRVKFAFGSAVVVGVFSILAMYLAILNSFAHLHHAGADILYWWFAELSVQLAVYSLAFLASVFIGNPLVGALVTYITLRTNDILLLVAPNSIYRIVFQQHYGWVLLSVLQHISPLDQFGAGWNIGMLPYLFWNLLITVLFYWFSQLAFLRFEPENALDIFIFPRMRQWGIVIFSLLAAFMIVEVLFFHPVSRVLKVVLFIFVTAFLLKWMTRLVGYSTRRL